MKIRNLHMAARLLNAAGYRDHAESARKEASRIEGEMRKAEELKKREAEEAKRRDMEKRKAEEAKRHDMEKRKAEEAKRHDMEKRKAEEKKDRPDPAAGMREEMQKLRREVEELRGQLKQAKAAAEARPERDRREQNRPR
jgi:hypothetical protein